MLSTRTLTTVFLLWVVVVPTVMLAGGAIICALQDARAARRARGAELAVPQHEPMRLVHPQRTAASARPRLAAVPHQRRRTGS